MNRQPSSISPYPATRWIKADLHLHTAEDPCDVVDYTALQLLERAHALGFGALAVTLHNHVFCDPAAFDRARELGILLIPGAEMRIGEADVVILNLLPRDADRLHSFDDLRQLRQERGESLFVFAPHPFYVLGGSMGRERLEANLDCFDAIEFCHFHLPGINPNAPAMRLAGQHGKPVLATSDSHRWCFFGQNYSLLEVEQPDSDGAGTPTVEAVFSAIRAGRIQRVSPPTGLLRLFALLIFLFFLHPLLKRLPANRRRRQAKARATPRPRPASTPAEVV